MSQKDLTLEVLYRPQSFLSFSKVTVLMYFLFKKVDFLFNKYNSFNCFDFPALRVRRTETRLTVYWASQ